MPHNLCNGTRSALEACVDKLRFTQSEWQSKPELRWSCSQVFGRADLALAVSDIDASAFATPPRVPSLAHPSHFALKTSRSAPRTLV